jgi:hypothetical protein
VDGHGGIVTGTGAGVRWLLPAVTVPTPFDLNLTVIERYTVAPPAASTTRENRTTGKATVHVNDSSREITDLATTFIDDFLHSERPPEFPVRNFSNGCPGKQEELNDIRANRAGFVNNPSASSMGPGSITSMTPAARSAWRCRRRRRLRRVLRVVPFRGDRTSHQHHGSRGRHLRADRGLRKLSVASATAASCPPRV